MRGVIGPRSMVAFWLSGLGGTTDESGEICVAEIFGSSARNGFAEVGMGIKAFRDPALREAVATERIALDIGAFHTYAVDWRPGSLAFAIDGRVVRRLDQAPAYPMLLELAVFDFPARPAGEDEPDTPELVVAHVRSRPLGD
jgi:beta-glucanase (GH16 family)